MNKESQNERRGREECPLLCLVDKVPRLVDLLAELSYGLAKMARVAFVPQFGSLIKYILIAKYSRVRSLVIADGN